MIPKKIAISYHNITFNFSTITEAYHFYLKYFATIGEWWYYLRVAHTLLNKVTDEEVMESIFTHVFQEDVYLIVNK